MTPPLSLSNCPPEIQKNPLPFDECSPANPEWRPPSQRFPQLSVYTEYSPVINGRHSNPHDAGIGVLYRPSLYFGVGAQLGTNFVDQLQFLGRLQTSFNLQRHGMFRGTVAGLAGFNQYFGQRLDLADSSSAPAVTGPAFTAGGEIALDMRVFTWMTFSPFSRILYQPSTNLSQDADTAPVSVAPRVDFILGVRLAFDFLEKGN